MSMCTGNIQLTLVSCSTFSGLSAGGSTTWLSAGGDAGVAGGSTDVDPCESCAGDAGAPVENGSMASDDCESFASEFCAGGFTGLGSSLSNCTM